ncbi:unnamed protein product [Linum tenue]|uniref:Uncharacterized protein n=1 Tax=Linum tenue TaxID=586396 RepID=A0AAV0Q0T9_9ROSI|nr:unnamed protein product [Linum tenue]CAI0491087.1 unnamed protein product [Linum tenue]
MAPSGNQNLRRRQVALSAMN